MRPDTGVLSPTSPQPGQQQQQPQIIQIVPQQIISAQPRPISQPLGPPANPGTMQGRMVPLQKAAMVGGPTMVGGPVVSMPGMHMGMQMSPHMVVTSGQMSHMGHQMGHMTMNQMTMNQMSHLNHMSQMNQQAHTQHMQDYVNAAAFVPGQPYQTPGRHCK